MERDEFLKSLGIGLALVCTGSCFQSCSKGGDNEAEPEDDNTSGGKLTIETTALPNVGDYKVITDGTAKVLVFRTAAGNLASSFAATQAVCPHMGSDLVWQQANERIQCTNHQARFKADGSVISQPIGGGSVSALTTYNLTLSGTTLTATKKTSQDPPPTTGTQVSVDIATLATVGSQTTSNDILFYRINAANAASSFVAVEGICPHQGGNLAWQQANSRIQCPNHQAQFNSNGTVISGPTTGDTIRALKVYPVTLNGTTLTATKS